jgi:ferredoxin, 2Fe-2S
MVMKNVTIHVTDFEGKRHDLEGIEGWRLMEVIRDYGLPIKAECGGACACATCHVYVSPEWFDKLIPPNADETLMMDDAMAVEDNSRLSCQIILSPELEGLEVTLAPNP